MIHQHPIRLYQTSLSGRIVTQAMRKRVANCARLSNAHGMKNGFLMLDMMRAFYWFDEALQSALRARGWEAVSRSQSMTFINIVLGVRRPAELARNLGITRQGVSKMLQEMVDRDWIVIEPDPADKRASMISFSENSAQLRADALEILSKIDLSLADRLGDKSLQALRNTLARDWGPPPQIAPEAEPAPAAE